MQSIEACNNLTALATATAPATAVSNKPELRRPSPSLIRPGDASRITCIGKQELEGILKFENLNKVAYTILISICHNGTADS